MKYLMRFNENNKEPLYKEIGSEESNDFGLGKVESFKFSKAEIDSINNMPLVKGKYHFEEDIHKSRFVDRLGSVSLFAKLDILEIKVPKTKMVQSNNFLSSIIHSENEFLPFYSYITIKKYDDEWFYVEFSKTTFDKKYYKCDQLDGLEECLIHIININNEAVRKISKEEIKNREDMFNKISKIVGSDKGTIDKLEFFYDMRGND
jgi:RNAse (barnase) inhibitor barstar